jgi:4'-phosphopantetheinyl transferase
MIRPEAEPVQRNTAAVQLWLAYPGDLESEGVEQACAAALSGGERERAARFRFEQNRREYLATQALARAALSHSHPLPPEAWRFPTNPYGKPAAEPECGLRFNLSNCAGLAVCLVAREAEVGVDVEAHARADEIAALAPEVFSRREQEQLHALRGADRADRALSLWTLKEAYIKARGMGLKLPLGKLSFLFSGAEQIRLEIDRELEDAADRWRLFLLDHAGHRIAGVVERADNPALEVWEARPPLGRATRLPDANVRWFPQR